MPESDSTAGQRPLNPYIDVQKALKGVSYPADKNSLLESARSNGADEDTMRRLQDLPDQQYQSPPKCQRASATNSAPASGRAQEQLQNACHGRNHDHAGKPQCRKPGEAAPHFSGTPRPRASFP
ncbi:DUF2795 domain-containing protein [Paraburkholderia sp. MMS20-SJTN17]|uniref:DUF2795 domain-containing protein n=1 Tax=Paraburkholderia translucens TaxID=2886945 RepID=A0ABS8KHZ9_9BURK|nr:DUF2795 domain-containing protein [Paraburkholderia sp. MMS20-SJTN17]MCC8404039.1 DUF2795 domain-containing protein [Paraburkholderia sp. MMS20-SJTN17]